MRKNETSFAFCTQNGVSEDDWISHEFESRIEIERATREKDTLRVSFSSAAVARFSLFFIITPYFFFPLFLIIAIHSSS